MFQARRPRGAEHAATAPPLRGEPQVAGLPAPEQLALPAVADDAERPAADWPDAQAERVPPAEPGPARDLPKPAVGTLPEDVHPAAGRHQRKRRRAELPAPVARPGPATARSMRG